MDDYDVFVTSLSGCVSVPVRIHTLLKMPASHYSLPFSYLLSLGERKSHQHEVIIMVTVVSNKMFYVYKIRLRICYRSLNMGNAEDSHQSQDMEQGCHFVLTH